MTAAREKVPESGISDRTSSAPSGRRAGATRKEPGPENWAGDVAGLYAGEESSNEQRAAAAGENASPPPRPDMFEGDADLLELRRRLSVDPDFIPEPPRQAPQRSAAPLALVAQTIILAASTAVVVFGVVEFLLARDQIMSRPNDIHLAALKSQAAPADERSRPTAPVLLGIHDQQALMDEPLALGAVLFGAGEETLHVTGLTEGSRLSVGEPNGSAGWRVPAQDVAGVLVLPPPSFVGTMHAVIKLHSPDRNAPVDTQFARFEWVAKPPREFAQPQLDRRDTAQLAQTGVKLDPQRMSSLVNRGLELIRNGNFAAARLVLRPAAEAGDPQAALMLGATFDPVIVAEQGVLGLEPDPSVARSWYQRALELGSSEASRRIERLAEMSNQSAAASLKRAP